jgi:hypothetical protein
LIIIDHTWSYMFEIWMCLNTCRYLNRFTSTFSICCIPFDSQISTGRLGPSLEVGSLQRPGAGTEGEGLVAPEGPRSSSWGSVRWFGLLHTPIISNQSIESVYLISPSIYVLSSCLSICLSIYLSIYRSIFLPIYLSIYLSIYPSIYLSICLIYLILSNPI